MPEIKIQIKQRNLFSRIIRMPFVWMKHYSVLRCHNTRFASAYAATVLTRFMLKNYQ